MDRGTIRTEVQRQVGEPASGGFWSNTDYDNVINRAQSDFAMRTKCLKTYAEFATTVSTHLYDMSEDSLSNLVDIAEVQFFLDANNYESLRAVTRDELSTYQGCRLGMTGTPYYYCYEDRTIEFDCDTEASKTVRVYYYKRPTDMDGDADVPEIPVKFHDALVNFVCWKFAEGDELDVERTAYFKQQYMEDVSRATMILRPGGTTYGGIKDDTEIG
jgi:hypothetical protein